MDPQASAPDLAALARMELFAGLSAKALADVAAEARTQRLPPDTVIFAQGDVARAGHALLEGRVRITQSDEDGAELLVRFIGPGDMFGTVGLFTDGRYPAEALTAGSSVEIHWPESALLALLGRHPQIALNMVRIIGRRLREVQERLRELGSQRAERRIAHVLLRLAEQAAQGETDGPAIAFPLTRKDVANMCGATLHTASRVLTAWGRVGMIESSRERIVVRDLAAIRHIAGDRR